jgi:formylmethanofuran dehydrogenase subunit D
MKAAVTIIAFSEIFHSTAEELGRLGKDYAERCAQIFLDKADMAASGAKDGETVRIEIHGASLILTARQSDDEPHQGIAFMFRSPWYWHLAGEGEMDCTKRESRLSMASISWSGEKATGIDELISRLRA